MVEKKLAILYGYVYIHNYKILFKYRFFEVYNINNIIKTFFSTRFSTT